ncbi:hypothetical protein [Vermiculatibacterium agrestimuris]|uniref:hypothetical protein n=1 Tax=Vermiculatibacterium agrestimuris TaxID=2941519 RepID=UPI00203B86CB|nr:hypothetical protein [Vermiculatibacterium agrestimuris]
MAELQEQLQAILGDPQAMSQITAIAQALTGGSPKIDPSPAQEPPAEADYVPVEAPALPEGTAAPATGADTANADGPDLSALLGALGGGGLGDLDPRLLQIALKVYGEYSAQDDEKAALLSSLKPFLRPERQEKLEKAEKIARLSRVVRVAVALLKEEGGHV